MMIVMVYISSNVPMSTPEHARNSLTTVVVVKYRVGHDAISDERGLEAEIFWSRQAWLGRLVRTRFAGARVLNPVLLVATMPFTAPVDGGGLAFGC